jgi:3,4-dihydroxy-2-butanone 4-phosphate synthase
MTDIQYARFPRLYKLNAAPLQLQVQLIFPTVVIFNAISENIDGLVPAWHTFEYYVALEIEFVYSQPFTNSHSHFCCAVDKGQSVTRRFSAISSSTRAATISVLVCWDQPLRSSQCIFFR